jgi:hypothetical protein
VNRRAFLATCSLSTFGCWNRGNPAAPDAELANARQNERGMLSRFRVPVGAQRTTAPPPVNVLEIFPELKPLLKITVRLHPRYGDEPDRTRSKLGGTLAGPPPLLNGQPGIGVLQLHAEDAPPQLRYPPDKDLLQLYWFPGEAGQPPIPRLVWGESQNLPDIPEKSPSHAGSIAHGLEPIPCRVHPERVWEFPPPSLMPRMMRERIQAWRPNHSDQPGISLFFEQLAAAPGTKVGGWPRWKTEPRTPACPGCRRLMDYLLTVDRQEWQPGIEDRWIPQEEQDLSETEGYRQPTGLSFAGHRAIHCYLCSTCEDYPAATLYADLE